MTAEKVLRITKKEKEVINDLYEAVMSLVDDTESTASTEFFESVLRDIVEGIYYNQSTTDEHEIRIITEEGWKALFFIEIWRGEIARDFAEISIIPHPQDFVKWNFEKNCTNSSPEICLDITKKL